MNGVGMGVNREAGSMKKSFCGDKTILYLDYTGWFVNLYMDPTAQNHTHTHTQLNAYTNRWKLNKVSSLVWQPGSVLNQCQLPSMDMVLQLHKMLLLGYGFNVLVFLLNYESIIISK